MTLLGAPVLKGKAQDKAIQDKIDDLTRAVERLKQLQTQDALVILQNSLAIPTLLYLLRTSQCSDNPLQRQFDYTLRTGLINILIRVSGSKPHYPSEVVVREYFIIILFQHVRTSAAKIKENERNATKNTFYVTFILFQPVRTIEIN